MLFLVGVAAIFSLFGLLPFNAAQIIISVVILLISCYISNYIFAYVFEANSKNSSVYISALILALIITPINSTHSVLFLLWAGVLAMAFKYILALGKRHIFNPVAITMVITSLVLGQAASWWVGTAIMLPFVIIGGIILVQKLRRWPMVISFLLTALIIISAIAIFKGNNLAEILKRVFLDTPIFFMGFVMLTDPMTSPAFKPMQIFIGALVGFLFVPEIHLGAFYTTPELALVIGNLFYYFSH